MGAIWFISAGKECVTCLGYAAYYLTFTSHLKIFFFFIIFTSCYESGQHFLRAWFVSNLL